MKSEQAGSEHQNKPAGGWCKGSARKVQAIKDRQIRKLQEIHFFFNEHRSTSLFSFSSILLSLSRDVPRGGARGGTVPET